MAGSSLRHHGVQAGFDKLIPNVPDSDLFLGLMGGYSWNDTDFNVGDATTTSAHVGVYGTLVRTDGWYVDLIGRFFRMDHELKTLTADSLRVRGDGKTHGYSTGVEVGRRISLSQGDGGGWFLEPEAQVTYSRFHSASIRMNHGLKTTVHGYHSLLGRAGLLLGYSVDRAGTVPVDLYVKANYQREWQGDAAYIYNDHAPTRQHYRFGRHWAEAGAGCNAWFRERHSVYADYLYAKGGGVHQHQVNIGYRLQF
ncbi:MAG: autotransporter outer membrane beta-barrel domain-containing protein [Planctomycetes bacterium]|nr:autotransporter outer membrane beta-barrel domain-containing protein [Planctomycetota bacterium]